MAVIRFADAQRATIPANPSPIRANRSSDLSQTFCTDLTMLRDEDSELSPVAFATKETRPCLSGVANSVNL